MTIKIIGSNTEKGLKLRKRVIKIASNIEGKVIINLIDESTEKKLPILYINEYLVSKGNIPNEKEILKFIKNNL